MPLQNRVTPLGELIAHPARGLHYERLTELRRGLHPGRVGADSIDERLHGEPLDPSLGRSGGTT